MPHILTLQGSPRRGGNTATVLRCFEDLATAAAFTLEHIEIGAAQIEGCRGCLACQKVWDEPGCRRKDQALAIFERMRAAELIVYATPLYCWSFTTQMKALIDRHFCLVKWHAPGGRRSLLAPLGRGQAGKRAALLVTCGDEIENNADVIQTIFRREMDCLDVAVAGIYILPGCPDTGHPGERAAVLASRMAAELVGAA